MLDKAHVIKNEKNQLRAVLAGVRTMRRVLLTGTPLQNNLREYFHMVDYASPGELGDLDTFKRLYESTITDGQFRYGEDDDESRSQRAKTRREVCPSHFRDTSGTPARRTLPRQRSGART